MTPLASPTARASTLVVTLASLTAVSLMAAFTLVRVSPRLRMAYQNAAWQEARVAAEAGVDAAMGDLMRNATGFSPGGWPGWKTDAPASGGPNGPIANVLNITTNTLGSLLGILGGGAGAPPANNSVASSAPIYLDNLKVSASSGLPTELDVSLWALAPTSAPHTRWFRIRSMATCALPSTAYSVSSKLDAAFRRFSMRAVRPTLRRDDRGRPSTIPLPNTSRTIEVLVEPILPFELAVWTRGSLRLAPTGLWNIDSFDSRSPSKSVSGRYPGRGSSLVQENGSIATSQLRPFDSLYGPLIDAQGAEISGAVATNGGDDPATEPHENVTGAIRIDPSRIRSDFSREMPPLAVPANLTLLPAPRDGVFTPGPAEAPACYRVDGPLTRLRIPSAPPGSSGALIIVVNGNLALDGPLILPPSVAAILFVRGDMTIRDSVNYGPWSSNRAAQLLFLSDNPPDRPNTLRVEGACTVNAAFYGPATALALDGDAQWIGSLAGASFEVLRGGNGGIHYDQALATIGPAIGFRIVRYVEDVRQ